MLLHDDPHEQLQLVLGAFVLQCTLEPDVPPKQPQAG